MRTPFRFAAFVAGIIFFPIVWSTASDLPRASQELVEKLEAFEKAETEKLEALLAEKREAVVKLLEQQATDEARKGNVDGSMAIREKIVELGGEPSEESMAAIKPAVSWEVPDDAVLYRGDYYKIYPLAQTISWEEARARCRAVGGEIGWLDRDEDEKELRKWLQPIVNEKGHSPIWMGAQRNDAGDWQWMDGSPVDDDIWGDDTMHAAAKNTRMIRWIGGFSAANPESGRKVIGYLCRWKR